MKPAQPEPSSEAPRELGAGIWIWCAALLVVPLIVFRLPEQQTSESEVQTTVLELAADPIAARGQELARVVCGTCHAQPLPETATREQWAFEILPGKRKWLGLDPFDFENHPGGSELKESPVFPEQATVSLSEWSAICNYYLATSSADGGVRTVPVKEPEVWDAFDVQVVPATQQPRYTSVAIDAALGVFYVGNENDSSIEVWSADGQRVTARAFNSGPSAMTVLPQAVMISVIGNRELSEESNGGLIRMSKPGVPGPPIQMLDNQLRRPMDLAVADLDQDGKEDYVVAERGGYLGLLSWMKNLGGSLEVNPLLERAGTRAIAVADMNADSRPDIVAVTSHGYEAIELFIAKGDGFERKTVSRKHPRWWFADIAVADVNGDQLPDLVTANGWHNRYQNQPEPIAADHGVSVWVADGKGDYTGQRIRQLAGARRVIPADLDSDGDVDLVAIGYSNQPEALGNESLVLLVNDGAMNFSARTIAAAANAHWSDLAAGDLDQDGDTDLVIVASHPGNDHVPVEILKKWVEAKTGMLILRNRGGK
ncbi:MAG: FG-GAP repeat domain-containing protein [Limisphaerales bacterium]